MDSPVKFFMPPVVLIRLSDRKMGRERVREKGKTSRVKGRELNLRLLQQDNSLCM